MSSNPHEDFKTLTGHTLDDRATGMRQSYLAEQEVGSVAKGIWNDPLFTLGFEYGLLAMSNLVESRRGEKP